jgi:HSP20 family molecular chaperone IbpA
MSAIKVNRYDSSEKGSTGVLEELERVFESIRERAFDLFLRRSNKDQNRELDDWLQAERELFDLPRCEMVEKENEYAVSLAMPGIHVSDIELTASPERIVVTAQQKFQRERDGKVHFSEFSEKCLLRVLDFPTPVDVDKIQASLQNGMLQVTAPKQAEMAETPEKPRDERKHEYASCA